MRFLPATLLALLSAVAGSGALAAQFVVTNTSDGGIGSLRGAVELANATANGSAPDEIKFNIPGTGVRTITLNSALPAITDPVVIDGWSQPRWNNAPLIELTAAAGTVMDGISISGGGTTVRGLVLNGFTKAVAITSKGNNTILGCYIGTDSSGTSAVPNDVGISSFNTSNNRIGGSTSQDRNIISGNRRHGVAIDDADSRYDPSTGGHVIQGNYIGTDVSGTRAVPNFSSPGSSSATGGLHVIARGTLIGGAAPGEGNVVSGNNAVGIWQYGSAVRIFGNIVGADATGSLALPNASTGISMQSLGGQIGSGGTIGEGNLVSGNRGAGVVVASAQGTIQGNKIGTTVDGKQALPNQGHGILLAGSDNLIGGQLPSARNLISANTGSGIVFFVGQSFVGWTISNQPAYRTLVRGNFIGTDISGTVALPNGGDGVDGRTGEGTIFGGQTRGAGNLISGNRGHGIRSGPYDSIRGNRIGTQIDGAAPLGNQGHGIAAAGAGGVTVGATSGYSDDAANEIAFNGGAGVALALSAPAGGRPPGLRISANSIHDNGGPEIDIGENGPSPPPVALSEAFGFEGKLTIYGSLTGVGNSPYSVEFFANRTAGATGQGEGETFLGRAGIRTDANGQAKFNVTFPLPADAASVSATVVGGLSVSSEFAANAAVSRSAPSETSVPPTPVTLPIYPDQLLNISTRMQVGTGDHVLIAGFIVTGSEAKKVIVRGIGPSLASSNIAGVLQDPVLELYDASGQSLATNDNWQTDQAEQIRETGVAPNHEREAALVRTLPAGSYTVALRGAGATSGVGLVEVYDISANRDVRVVNISTRGFIAGGDKVLIGGFITGAGGARTDVVVRALGPSLSKAGIAEALPDPNLELRDRNGTLLRFNDDWTTLPPADSAGFREAGLAPNDRRESAVIINVNPGNYTAIVRGQPGVTGVALVEVYELGR